MTNKTQQINPLDPTDDCTDVAEPTPIFKQTPPQVEDLHWRHREALRVAYSLFWTIVVVGAGIGFWELFIWVMAFD